jgi:protein N-terminal methyltransferase
VFLFLLSQVYSSAREFWDHIASCRQSGEVRGNWYSSAVEYWDGQSATNNGVLGGFGRVNPADIMDSRRFLIKSFSKRFQEAKESGEELVAADCGAGIGRVSKELLMHFFQQVDVVEPSEHLLEAAKRNLSSGIRSQSRPVNFFKCGLEGFEPEPDRYDALWIQWALMYLTDNDAIEFLKRCKATMRKRGRIFLKENVCDGGFIVDSDDCSITRSHAYFIELFRSAGVKLEHTSIQKNFPKQLFKVRMYALSCSD